MISLRKLALTIFYNTSLNESIFESVPPLFFRAILQEELSLQERDELYEKNVSYREFVKLRAELHNLHTFTLNEENIQSVYPEIELLRMKNFNKHKEILRKLPNLTSLDLRCNYIGDEGCKYLAESENLRNVTRLDLECNLIGDEGCKYLFAQDSVFRNATCIDLERNPIGAEGCKYLAESDTFRNVTHFDLWTISLGTAKGYKYIVKRYL